MGTITNLVVRDQPGTGALLTLQTGCVESVIVADAMPRVRVRLDGGSLVTALLPQHIDTRWLLEAVAIAPIVATVLPRPSGEALLCAVYPGEAHANVRADVLIVGRNVSIDASTAVEINAPSICAAADNQHVIRGGIVRIN